MACCEEYNSHLACVKWQFARISLRRVACVVVGGVSLGYGQFGAVD